MIIIAGMDGLTFDEAEELRRDYRHMVGELFNGKEVSEVITGPADKDTLFLYLDRRDEGNKPEKVLEACNRFEVYLLLDYNKYIRRIPTIVLLRAFIDKLTGDY